MAHQFRFVRFLTLLLAVVIALASASELSREERLAERREENWLKSILSCPLCKGKEVLACYRPCRAQGGGMGQCLSGCMTNNPLVLEMMLKMVPNDPTKKPEQEEKTEKVSATSTSASQSEAQGHQGKLDSNNTGDQRLTKSEAASENNEENLATEAQGLKLNRGAGSGILATASVRTEL
eukprot:CAMPEP_0194760856 /NCGR_PEP_ID=MMETSP0323_2-20130528/13697_1 /TAXON_ID=2866 ORGANISM="Crypthecodinium cohnii, Strain Seligo" /NCGR_SAMPLE_ID=MMETSP0323_2 /ASSEMBLY_ACC=CAM_ASM_000346 /LENGTH=179 /DNA_ID=CAMNT_0039682347 /DNA_START=36 /DNA_END=575 /DNA_ORIENTATION=+